MKTFQGCLLELEALLNALREVNIREKQGQADLRQEITQISDGYKTIIAERDKLKAEIDQERHDAEHAVECWEKALAEIGEYENKVADLTNERDTLKQENKKLKAELDEVTDTVLHERERHESDKLRLERNIEYYKKRLQAWSDWGDKTTAMWKEWRDETSEETALTGEGTLSLSVEKPSETYTAGSTDKILKAASQE